MMSRIILILCLLAAVASAAISEPSAAPKVSLDAAGMSYADAFASLARQSRMVILTADIPDTKLNASLQDVPLDTALKLVCGPAKLSYKKVLAAPGPKGEYDAKKLVRALRALDEMGASGLMVRDPETGATSVALGGIPSKVTVEPSALPGAPALKEVYLIYGKEPTAQEVATRAEDPRPAPQNNAMSAPAPGGSNAPMAPAGLAGAPPVAKVGEFAHDQAAAMAALGSMSSRERHDAMRTSLQMFKQLDPQTRKNMARMGLQMYMQMDPATRNKLANQIRREMKLPKNTPIPGYNSPDRRSRNRQPGR